MDTCQYVLDMPIDTAPSSERKTSKYKLSPKLEMATAPSNFDNLVVFLAKH